MGVKIHRFKFNWKNKQLLYNFYSTLLSEHSENFFIWEYVTSFMSIEKWGLGKNLSKELLKGRTSVLQALIHKETLTSKINKIGKLYHIAEFNQFFNPKMKHHKFDMVLKVIKASVWLVKAILSHFYWIKFIF